jgi:hypothetical protein
MWACEQSAGSRVSCASPSPAPATAGAAATGQDEETSQIVGTRPDVGVCFPGIRWASPSVPRASSRAAPREFLTIAPNGEKDGATARGAELAGSGRIPRSRSRPRDRPPCAIGCSLTDHQGGRSRSRPLPGDRPLADTGARWLCVDLRRRGRQPVLDHAPQAPQVEVTARRSSSKTIRSRLAT